MRVLLVEDDAMLGEGVRRGLRQQGHAVDWVQDGEAAELALAGEPYDAVARAGIQPGDVVIALNGTEVKDVAQLRTLVSRAGKHVALLIERGQARIFVPVDLG